MAVTWKKLAYEDDVVTKALFDAYSVLYADTDNTPAALTVNASSFVGRAAAGGIVALAKAAALTILNVEDGADATDATNVDAAGAVMEGDFGAYSILAADTIDTPVSVALAASQMIGRLAAGGIVALTAANVRTIANVADGADVTANNAPQAHAASHQNAGSDELTLDTLGEPVAAVAFDGQQLTDTVIHTVANAAGRPTAVVGKVCWQTDELCLYACTVSV